MGSCDVEVALGARIGRGILGAVAEIEANGGFVAALAVATSDGPLPRQRGRYETSLSLNADVGGSGDPDDRLRKPRE